MLATPQSGGGAALLRYKFLFGIGRTNIENPGGQSVASSGSAALSL